MAKQLQIRGGTTAQHATFVGAGRELTVDTTKQTVVVHDGTTAGGFPLAKESVVTALNNRLTLVDNTADSTKNVLSATKLTTARTIAITGDITWSTSFDGSGNVTSAGTLANSGVTAGTYRSVTTDAKGRVTAGTNPTTLTGYGITDAYNKTEIDTFIQGFKPKTEVKLATTVNITLSGEQTIDGISAIVGDRVLVKNQTTQSENGIYVVSTTSWTRATDSDSALELTGSYCFVSQGSTQSDTGWYMNSDSVVLGTTAIVWIQFTGTGSYAPISHVGTNGTSHAAVTQSVNGFMLSTDKLKLDSATNINTANTIVMRDSSGNFTAGLIIGTSFNSITGLSSTTPLANGTAAIGTSTTAARADHVHPSDTTKISTDNAIVRFDGTTGAVQNSGVIINDINSSPINNSAGLSIIPVNGGLTSLYNWLDVSSLDIWAGSTQKTGIHINGQTAAGGSYFSVNTGGAERMRIDSSGNLGIVTPLNTWESRSRVIQTGFNNKAGYVIENFTSGNSADSNPVNTGVGFYRNTSNVFSYINSFTKPLLFSMFNGAYSWLTAPAGASDTPITWTNALTLDASGNLLLTSGTGALGYGTGAGGTVTQLTSKSTAVTLNKPTGKITMNNAAMAPGEFVLFNIYSNAATTSDIAIVAISGGVVNGGNYRTWCTVGTGLVQVYIENRSAATLSEALKVNFAIIKGAIS